MWVAVEPVQTLLEDFLLVLLIFLTSCIIHCMFPFRFDACFFSDLMHVSFQI